jgi:hypothetical protein
MGLFKKLQNGDTQLKSLKFGNDRPDGGSSKQPYIQTPIDKDPKDPILYKDFILRGGISAFTSAATDVSRLTKYFTDFKSADGILFTAKQNLLSRVSPETETSDKINGGIYTPLSTLAQAGVGFTGTHLNKQGLDSTSLFPSFNIKDYGPTIYNKNQLGSESTQNRLVQYLYLKQNQEDNSSDIHSYTGGPGSALGIGKTNIKFATDGGGAPLRTGINGTYKNPIFTKKPRETQYHIDEILGMGIDREFGVSFTYASTVSEDPEIFINELLGEGFQFQYDLKSQLPQDVGYSVYQPGTLTEISNLKSYLTSSFDTRTRNEPLITFTNPITDKFSNLKKPVIYQSPQSTSYLAVNDIDVILDKYNSTVTTKQNGYLGNQPHNPPGSRNLKGDFRKTSRKNRGFNDPILSYDKITDSSNYLSNTVDKIYYTSATTRTSTKINSSTDLIEFKINIVNPSSPTNEKSLIFRAYIDNFSDSYGADWSAQNYMGRAESFYKYKSFSRDISLGFTVVADSEKNLETMYRQLNTLAASIAPTYTPAGYMAGNLHRITMGNYIKGQYGVVTGFTYDITEESPWGIERGNQLPYYIKVTGFNLKVIHNFRPESQFSNPNHQFIKQSATTPTSTTVPPVPTSDSDNLNPNLIAFLESNEPQRPDVIDLLTPENEILVQTQGPSLFS